MNIHIRRQHRKGTIRLTLAGLIVLCVSMIAATAIAFHFTRQRDENQGVAGSPDSAPPKDVVADGNSQVGAWGELATLDMDFQQPKEYTSFESLADETIWTFSGMSKDQVGSLLKRCGMTGEQAAGALAAEKVEDNASAVRVRPDESLVLALGPEVRSKVYSELALWPENRHMQQPYHLSGGSFEEMFRKCGVSGETAAWVKKLMYSRGGNEYFSDPVILLRHITDPVERANVIKALTYQSAVMASLKISPDSDVDKLVGYWGACPGVRVKDLRPLLESVRNTPGGGQISLLYLLPAFARERLYTFALPSQAEAVKMDCHWTALNFFNEVPDDRLQDNDFAGEQIKGNYYQIGGPSKMGDLAFVLNSAGGVIHSAVYIAGDLYFTKNGINFGQPWILMHGKDLLTVYTHTGAPRVLYYRRKEA